MTALENEPDAAVDPEKDDAGKQEAAAERPFFVSPFREKVVYAYFMTMILLMSIVNLGMLILKYIEERDRCRCQT